MAADYPDRVAGMPYGKDTVIRRLEEVGCTVAAGYAPAEPTVAPWAREDGGTSPARGGRGRCWSCRSRRRPGAPT